MNNESEMQASALDDTLVDSVTTIRRVERPTAGDVDDLDTDTDRQSDPYVAARLDADVQADADTVVGPRADSSTDDVPDIKIEVPTDFDDTTEPQIAAPFTPAVTAEPQPEAELELADDELLVEGDASEDDTLVERTDPRSAQRMSSVPPPPPLAALRAAAHSSFPPGRQRSSAPPPFDATRAGAAAAQGAINAELRATRAELDRVARRMRARDAYLVELERALQTANRQIETSRARTAGDNARLLGRVRGQAFRVAELEDELRQAVVALAAERASTRRLDAPNQNDLQLIRGIGPRFESQLRAMGIATLHSVAQWTAADITRVAEQLNIRPQRIERDAWIDQARALSSHPK